MSKKARSHTGKVHVLIRTPGQATDLLPYLQQHGSPDQVAYVTALSRRERIRAAHGVWVYPASWVNTLIRSWATPVVDLEMPIEELGLKVYGYNILKRCGVNNLGELIAKTEADLLSPAFPRLGQKSIDEIKAKLAGMGLALKEPEANAAPRAA